MPRPWPDMPKSYTCGCGLYVHPDSPHRDDSAIHIHDCPYKPTLEPRTMSTDVSNSDDIIDSRDVIARIRELEDEREDLSNAVDERNEELTDADNSEEYGSEESDAVHEAQERLSTAQDALQEWDADNGEELKALQALESEAEGYSDWRHGAQLIRDSYFETYARDTAEDLYNVQDATWPYTCIDWEKAADELKQDYTSVTFDGVDYWVRS